MLTAQSLPAEAEAARAQAEAEAQAAGLACWQGKVRLEPLSGGISNHNFLVTGAAGRFVVRIGPDVPVHNVLRRFELASSRAAHAAGISPEVVHAEPGAIVFRYIEGRTLAPEDVRAPAMLERIVRLVRTSHRELPRHLRGPAPLFWVFHALRDYGATLQEGAPAPAALPELLEAARLLEDEVGPVRLVFGHNDLLAANLIDDGRRLWLIDWEYGGFNSPLFDLGNLASNNGLSTAQEDGLLKAYFGRAPDAALRRSYQAMRCASLLREALWSLVSERHLTIAFDYRAYAADYLTRFERAYALFRAEHP